ncbi:hypothetical protein [Nocardia pseudovaccinii]|uniref:hypothetical protein n=1 Tax=Nocardia pseudovaccinii TaxID=189540 RepID=UPI0007A42192|nr:hypothetical protein [Nocardia pseudovaccinii]
MTTQFGAEPTLDRPIELNFRGDWGQANFHRVCGWIAQEVGDRCPDGSRFAIWSGRGGADQLDALQAGEVDIVVVTPTAAVCALFNGAVSIGGRSAQPNLRALGVIGQRDRLVVAVDAELPVQSVADLAATANRLVIATSQDDGVNLIGWTAHHGLRLAGADPESLRAAGGRFLYSERPFPAIHRFATGEANVLIHEAIMMPAWQRIAKVRPVRYLDWGAKVFDSFAALGWPAAEIEAGYLPGLEQPLSTLDFSDFAIVCRDGLPEDVAYLATWCMIRTRRALEVQYAHFPPDHTPVTYPLDLAAMANAPIPLHPGAVQAYSDLAGDTGDGEILIWS